LFGLAMAFSWPVDEAAPRAAKAAVAKPVEKQAASSMLAESGYAIAKDKLD
jgi:hypothetical protein